MTTYGGATKKFSIHDETGETVDCYLTLGRVGIDDWETFPHLSIGDICYIQLVVGKQNSELLVYQVLADMMRKLIACGGTAADVAQVLVGHSFPPSGPTGEGPEGITIAKSICDYVGRYLQRKETT